MLLLLNDLARGGPKIEPGKTKKKKHRVRAIPDHATFREKEYTLGWLDKLGVFPSLALCNLANFNQL